MAFCNIPSHAQRVGRVNIYREREGKKPVMVPLWVKDEQGRPPREMHIQVFREGELEVQWILRPCRICIKRLVHIYLQLNFDTLIKAAPELAEYIREAPAFMTQQDVDWEREYRSIRKWIRLAIEEFMKFWVEEPEKSKEFMRFWMEQRQKAAAR